MTLNPLRAGEDLTAGRLNALYDEVRTVYQSADQIRNNSTTLLSSTFLVLSVEVNSWYAFESLLMITSGTTPDWKFNLSCPAGSAMTISTWGSATTTTAADDPIFHDAIVAFGAGMGSIGTGTIITARPVGILSTAGTAGNATMQFAQNTANASDTTLKTGSWMRLTKVA